MNTYRYTYVSYVDAAQASDVSDIVGYLSAIGGTLAAVDLIDVSGTHFARSEADDLTDPTSLLRVVTTGIVEAAYSTTEGEDVPWEGSAEEVVEQGSFATTDSWDIGFIHTLTITPESQDFVADLRSPLLNGPELPAPVHSFTAEELATVLY